MNDIDKDKQGLYEEAIKLIENNALEKAWDCAIKILNATPNDKVANDLSGQILCKQMSNYINTNKGTKRWEPKQQSNFIELVNKYSQLPDPPRDTDTHARLLRLIHRYLKHGSFAKYLNFLKWWGIENQVIDAQISGSTRENKSSRSLLSTTIKFIHKYLSKDKTISEEERTYWISLYDKVIQSDVKLPWAEYYLAVDLLLYFPNRGPKEPTRLLSSFLSRQKNDDRLAKSQGWYQLSKTFEKQSPEELGCLINSKNSDRENQAAFKLLIQRLVQSNHFDQANSELALLTKSDYPSKLLDSKWFKEITSESWYIKESEVKNYDDFFESYIHAANTALLNTRPWIKTWFVRHSTDNDFGVFCLQEEVSNPTLKSIELNITQLKNKHQIQPGEIYLVKQIFQDSDSPLLEIKKDINSELWSDIPLVTAVIEHVNEVKAVSSAYFGDKIPCLIYHDRFPSASKLGIGDFQEVCPLESMNGNVSFAIVVKECTGSPSADFYRQFQTGVISYIDPQNEYCFIKTEIGIEAFVSPSIFKSINSSSEADFSGSLLKKWSSESNSFKWSVLELNQNDV